MLENGSAGTTSSVGGYPATTAPHRLSSRPPLPRPTRAGKPVSPNGPNRRHSMWHAKRGLARRPELVGRRDRGVVVLLVGIYALVQPENAAGIMRQLIAFVLLVVSAGRIIEGSDSAHPRRRHGPPPRWCRDHCCRADTSRHCPSTSRAMAAGKSWVLVCWRTGSWESSGLSPCRESADIGGGHSPAMCWRSCSASSRSPGSPASWPAVDCLPGS